MLLKDFTNTQTHLVTHDVTEYPFDISESIRGWSAQPDGSCWSAGHHGPAL
ncbi:hypothetical protein HLY00_3029 [Mycolicibacterium hippocampi]|uniref:Uncharacterized protein n=1 Tax=Mycolicibacterium hippocampi TaxID=659824 RepID=A0A850PZT7_9MYCO|nr:hypothetical protein [Mycolicibacterium hippocampi]